MITLHFLRYNEVMSLSAEDRIKRIINLVKDNKIVLLEGKVGKEEEAQLISSVMQSIDQKFKGIELATVDPDDSKESVFGRIRSMIASLLLGNRSGFTIIGPANIVKEIKRDPSKIELYMVGK